MAAHQAPLSLGFSMQEHWSGLPFPSPMHESEKWKWKWSHIRLLATPWTAAYQAPPSYFQVKVLEWSAIAFSTKKTSTSALYANAFDYVDHNKLWKILKDMSIPNHLTCFLRNLYADQEATVRTGHGTTEWFQIGKGVRHGPTLTSIHDYRKNHSLD